jgi:hypothetical protein
MSCHAVIVRGGTSAPHRVVSTKPSDEESIATMDAAMPHPSASPPPGCSMMITPTMPSAAPTAARSVGRCRSSTQLSSSSAAAEVDMIVAARLVARRCAAT